MKLIFLVITACLALASSEFCKEDKDCTLTQCVSGLFRQECFRDHVCSCIPSRAAYNCKVQNDCNATLIGSCNYNDHKWHCVDGDCHCRFLG